MRIEELSRKIAHRISQLSPQLALGGRFLVDHPDAVVSSSMREIAGRISVSPATLVRLARELGFDDWSSLRAVYVSEFSSSPHYAERADAITRTKGALGLISEVQRSHRNAIEHTAKVNSLEAIDEAAKILNRAPRIFVAAFMSCRAPALLFTYICRMFRSNVAMLGGEGGSLTSDLAALRADDVVLAIDFLPYAGDTRRVAESVSRSGATLVSIVDSRVTPLSGVTKELLLFSPATPSFFPSLTGAVALVETLVTAMLAHAGNRASSRVGEIEAALYKSGAYDSTIHSKQTQ
jgi:DNA-binding MurR/RpiR family transcriptional regulator